MDEDQRFYMIRNCMRMARYFDEFDKSVRELGQLKGKSQRADELYEDMRFKVMAADEMIRIMIRYESPRQHVEDMEKSYRHFDVFNEENYGYEAKKEYFFNRVDRWWCAVEPMSEEELCFNVLVNYISVRDAAGDVYDAYMEFIGED